jgi:hypothetical protein
MSSIVIAPWLRPFKDKAWCLYDKQQHRFVANEQGQPRVFLTRSGARGVRSLIVNGIRPLYTM